MNAVIWSSVGLHIGNFNDNEMACLLYDWIKALLTKPFLAISLPAPWPDPRNGYSNI
jgi:hypothetical protein